MNLSVKKYPGSKNAAGMKQFLLNKIHQCDVFHELFGGSAFVSKQLISSMAAVKEIIVYESVKKVSDQLLSMQAAVLNIDSMEYWIDKLESGNLDLSGHFFYADPPYMFSSRRSQSNIYLCEWGVQQHHRFFYLCQLLNTAGAKVLVSHYMCDEYDYNFKLWNRDSCNTMTRGGMATEWVFYNYDIDSTMLATYKYLGKDFTDRQRIQRKSKNMISKLNSLPYHEKMYMLQHLQKYLCNLGLNTK